LTLVRRWYAHLFCFKSILLYVMSIDLFMFIYKNKEKGHQPTFVCFSTSESQAITF
jgi:hypothetical protein